MRIEESAGDGGLRLGIVVDEEEGTPGRDSDGRDGDDDDDGAEGEAGGADGLPSSSSSVPEISGIEGRAGRAGRTGALAIALDADAFIVVESALSISTPKWCCAVPCSAIGEDGTLFPREVGDAAAISSVRTSRIRLTVLQRLSWTTARQAERSSCHAERAYLSWKSACAFVRHTR